MDTEHICPACQKPLPANAPKGLCPECLMKAGFGSGVAPEPGQPSRVPAFVPPSVAELARLFPQFEILGLLGQGGMGAVYKARQPALDRLVALKILPPETGADSGFADRFTREARALARLSHPNIVAVHEFGQVRGGGVLPQSAVTQPSTLSPQPPLALHYFVMEYVEGLNLRQLEQAGRLSPREALKIIPQICDALQFAHDEGIVHRDIKPENVMLDTKGRVKITDFGLAKILGREPTTMRLTGAKDVMGTPHYMAPEQIEHPQEVDHRADIYSLGVVFYEMLTGELPLGRFAPPSRKVQVDVRLDEVVLHALEKEPERRYQQASQVKTDVETIAQTAAKSEIRPAATARQLGESPKSEVEQGPVVPAVDATRHVTLPFTADSVRTQFVILAVSWWIGLTLSIPIEFVPWLNVICLPAIIVSTVFWCILLYRHWSLLQGHGARTTPGKAVGYGFIPIFWFYWWFVAYAGLATDNNRYLARAGFTSKRMSYGLAVAYCVLGVLLCTVGLFPVVGAVLTVPLMVVGFILVVQQRDCVLAILEHRAQRREAGGLAGDPEPLPAGAAWAGGAGAGARFATAQATPPAGPAVRAAVGSAHFSRTAIWGAVWAPWFLAAAVLFLFATSVVRVPYGSAPPSPARWLIILGLPLLVLGLSAPFGTTILGGIAISQIRHSQGRLYGMGLAVFDALLFPLLALNGLIIGGWNFCAHELADALIPHLGRAVFTILMLTVLVVSCGAVSWLVIRAVWRAANRGTNEPTAAISASSPGQLPTQPSATSDWRTPLVIGVVIVLVIVAIPAGVTFLSLTALNAFRARTESPARVVGVEENTEPDQASGKRVSLDNLSEADRARALELFNDIEDFGHEFNAAFDAENLDAAKTGTRRLLKLLAEFNAVVRGTGYEFPAAILNDIGKVRDALDEGDWDKVRQAARHNDAYGREFKRIAARMVELARKQQGASQAALRPTVSVRLVQPDPVRRYWRWQVERPTSARLIYGLLDVTDSTRPQRCLNAMETTPSGTGTQDYVLRLNPEKNEWLVEIEDVWAEGGGRGAAQHRLPWSTNARLDATADSQARELSCTNYTVLWKGEFTTTRHKAKSLWFVARLAEASDPVTDILDVSDAVRSLDGTVLPVIPKSQSLPILRVSFPWGKVIAMLALSGVCLVALVGAGVWIWRGHAVGTALGRAAVTLAVGGIFTGGVTGLGLKLLGSTGIMPAYGVFLAFELGALIMGLFARRSAPGKVAAILAAAFAVASLLFLA